MHVYLFRLFAALHALTQLPRAHGHFEYGKIWHDTISALVAMKVVVDESISNCYVDILLKMSPKRHLQADVT